MHEPTSTDRARRTGKRAWTHRLAALCTGVGIAIVSPASLADEGGVSFWLPGQFGSLAALPTAPGWTLGAIYYHMSGDEAANKAAVRGGRIAVGVDATADIVFLAPTYVLAQPVLGGQASLSVGGGFARMKVDVGGTLTGPLGTALSGQESDTLTSVADLYPQGSIKWNRGVHNFVAYAMAGVPVGSYSVGRLANIGTNHWSIDAGGGYTYFDKKNEFSAVLGFTHNWENDDTNYRNGVDMHLDWGAAHFVSPQTFIGGVGYFYNQLSGDKGTGAVLGDYKSRVKAVGPQLGHFFKVGENLWYANVKGYYEFDAKNRPEGWNVWLTLGIPLGSPKK